MFCCNLNNPNNSLFLAHVNYHGLTQKYKLVLKESKTLSILQFWYVCWWPGNDWSHGITKQTWWYWQIWSSRNIQAWEGLKRLQGPCKCPGATRHQVINCTVLHIIICICQMKLQMTCRCNEVRPPAPQGLWIMKYFTVEPSFNFQYIDIY